MSENVGEQNTVLGVEAFSARVIAIYPRARYMWKFHDQHHIKVIPLYDDDEAAQLVEIAKFVNDNEEIGFKWSAE